MTPNGPYLGPTAQLTSKSCMLYIYSTNIGTEYFKHVLYSQFFSLQNAVWFIMLTCLVPVLFTFIIQDALKLKKNNSGAKRLINYFHATEDTVVLSRSGNSPCSTQHTTLFTVTLYVFLTQATLLHRTSPRYLIILSCT